MMAAMQEISVSCLSLWAGTNICITMIWLYPTMNTRGNIMRNETAAWANSAPASSKMMSSLKIMPTTMSGMAKHKSIESDLPMSILSSFSSPVAYIELILGIITLLHAV